MSLKIPWFPLASTVATVLGLIGLGWYECLSGEDKARADALVAEYARRLYGRAIGELTSSQRAQINSLVKADLAN